MNKKNKTIIVLGATGFIGMYTTKAFLENGFNVVATGRNSKVLNKLEEMGATAIELDITKPEDLEKLPKDNIYAIVLLAGLLPANSTADLKDDDNSADYFKVNVLGSINALEWARKHGVKKVLGNCSYGDVSGAWGKVSPIDEHQPRDFSFTGDHAVYVISRNACNDVMEYYNQQHNMQCCWFRFPPVYGVGPHGTIYVDGKAYKSGVATWIDNAREGKDIEIWGDKGISRDIVYVKDVAQAYVQAAQSNKAYGLYNMTSGVPLTLQKQVETIIDVFSPKSENPNNTEKRSKIVYCPEKQNNTPSFLFDISKAKRDFGYNPQFSDYKKMMIDYKAEEESGYWDVLQDTRKKD